MPRPLAPAATPAVLAFAVLALAVLPAPPARAAVGDAYITSDASDLVRTYVGTAGTYINVFTPSVNAAGQLGIHFGASNNRVLVGAFGGGVDEFNASSGAYIKTYNPGGGTQWAGLYAPTGGVYIGSWVTGDVREYDATTGAFIRVVCPVLGPADMRIVGNKLYIADYLGQSVKIVHAVSGAPMGGFLVPPSARPNDIVVLNGEILVSCMPNVVLRYDEITFAPIGAFNSAGWFNPHGIEISPHDGNIYVVEGGAGQVHVFDPLTFVELNPAWLTPAPGDKIVDIEFRPPGDPTPAAAPSWGSVKQRYR